jgi:hypothetical protein
MSSFLPIKVDKKVYFDTQCTLLCYKIHLDTIKVFFYCLGVSIFGLVRFLPKKITKSIYFYLKNKNLNRLKPTSFGSVWFGQLKGKNRKNRFHLGQAYRASFSEIEIKEARKDKCQMKN